MNMIRITLAAFCLFAFAASAQAASVWVLRDSKGNELGTYPDRKSCNEAAKEWAAKNPNKKAFAGCLKR